MTNNLPVKVKPFSRTEIITEGEIVEADDNAHLARPSYTGMIRPISAPKLPMPSAKPAPIVAPIPAIMVWVGLLCAALGVRFVDTWIAQFILAFCVIFAWTNGTWPLRQMGWMTIAPAGVWVISASIVFSMDRQMTFTGANHIPYYVHQVQISFWWVAFGLFAVMAASYMSAVIHRLLVEQK